MYADLTRKKCCKCKEEKELSSFNKDRRREDGLSNICKDCRKEERKRHRETTAAYNKKWRELNLDYAKVRDRNWNLKRNYNITLEEYDKLKEKQDGVCAVCGKNKSTKKDLCVDHDHQTGKIRGLLCDNCNKAIGLLEDSIDILQKAIQYLKNS